MMKGERAMPEKAIIQAKLRRLIAIILALGLVAGAGWLASTGGNSSASTLSGWLAGQPVVGPGPHPFAPSSSISMRGGGTASLSVPIGTSGTSHHPIVGHDVKHDLSRPLRDM